MSKAKDILKYWYHLEYFSPEYPKKRNSVVISKRGTETFPWEVNDDKQYDVYFGKVSIDELVRELNTIVGEEQSIEWIPGEICICGMVLDSEGKYIENSFTINPFFYAITTIIKEKTLEVNISDDILENFNKVINTTLMDGYSVLVDRNDFEKIIDLVTLGFEYKYDNDHLALVNVKEEKDKESDELDNEEQTEIMSSFYTKDIERVLSVVEPRDAICKYVEAFYNHDDKKKIDSDVTEMKKWLHPDKFPLGKWPSKYSPSLMQQVAINIAISKEERRQNIFSVNGPPGTGKTTLLKDIIASNIVDRANVLVGMDPNSFECKELDLAPEGNTKLKNYYVIPDEISQYGIIVASNNNAAVENISLELPKACDVRSDKTHTDYFDTDKKTEVYFTSLAGKLLGNEAWGLISARLGKKANIKKLNSMLTKFEELLIENNYTDKNCSWEVTKEKFINALNKVNKYREEIKKDVELLESLRLLDKAAVESKEALDEAKSALALADLENNDCDRDVSINKDLISEINGKIKYMLGNMSFFQRIFSTIGLGTLSKEIIKLKKEQKVLLIHQNELWSNQKNLKQKYEQCFKNKEEAYRKYIQANEQYKGIFGKIYESKDSLKSKYDKNLADDKYYENITYHEESQSSCPWTTKEYDELREELFYWALQVHKSFILSSKPIRQNIRMLSSMWGDAKFSAQQQKLISPHLFSTLSLLIPVISTTFASVASFLRYIDKGELGTLIIDESGQATPQSALGILWRTKNAIIVGDPLQVEPISKVPLPLMRLFGRRYGIKDDYVSSTLSVQNLADYINEYSGEINGMKVGCPLVIHRRCIEPMFTISNTISYGGRMFNQTHNRINMLCDTERFSIPKSCWIDVKGSEIGDRNHYVKEQGDIVLELFDDAVSKYGEEILSIGQNKMYIISPFTSVVNELQDRIWQKYKDHICFKDIPKRDIKNNWLNAFIGTVHRFQGKEANEVLLVLGCDADTGIGAANWAGSKPNILNVAVTRAKFRLAVIGDKDLWKEVNNFNAALKILEKDLFA